MSEEDKLFELLSKDPVAFSEIVLDVTPFPYQAQFLRDGSKRIVVCAGRQVGKSFMTSARAIWYALTHKKTTTLIVSATLRQSMLMFEKIISMISSSPLVWKSVTYHTRTRVRFRNDAWIIALPCGPIGSTLRGYTAHQIIVDEAAFVPEEVISEVVLPMLATTNGIAILLSTPFDKAHVFYKAFTSPNWSKYHIPSSSNPMITKEFLDEQLELNGELVYAQEYSAEFVDDDRAYFPMPLLRSCVHVCDKIQCIYCRTLADPETNLEQKPRKLYAGYDPGGKRDPSALVVVEKLSDKRLRVVLTKTRLADKKEDEENLYTRFTVEISDLHQRIHFSRLMVDSTGLGSPIVEHCKSLGLPTEGVALTVASKEEILSGLRLLLEKKMLELPDNVTLLTNLNCIEADRTPVGRYVFSHTKGSHDDLAYALALACWAANKPDPTVIMSSR